MGSGAFAQLCCATKATLFHYDRLGLLKQLLRLRAVFDFYLIALLKDTGSFLKKVRRYLQDGDASEFLKLLEKKLRIIQEERRRLARGENMLV